ncbi:MAG: M56 family metallopeptidase, partial [Planctomycetota bacterium]
MNAIVQTINAVGRAFVDFALPMLIQSSVLILILFLVDIALRRRVRAVFRYWIWMLVLLKLLLPPSLWSPVSFGTWLGDTLETPAVTLHESPDRPESHAPPAWQPQAQRADSAPGNTIDQPFVYHAPVRSGEAASPPAPMPETPEIPTPAVTDSVAPPATVGAPAPTLDWPGLVLLGWLAVVMALSLLLLQRALFVKGLVAQAEPAPARLQAALDECRTRMGLPNSLSLRISPNATSPAVCGLRRPVILIPRTLAPKLQPRDLQAVLLHELAHIKRNDLWVNLAQTLLQMVYFYNPLLWLANVQMRRVREQAVDEAVLVAMGESAREYPDTLLSVAKLAFKRRPALSLRLIGVVESRSALSGRIKHILHRPVPKSARLGLLSLLAVVVIAAVFLPMAKARPMTDRARSIMQLAEQEARTHNHAYVGTEHILLALAHDSDAVSAQVLANLGVDSDTLRAEMLKLVNPGAGPPPAGKLPRTPRAKRVMQYAREEARALNHDYLGTEHLLLGLMSERQGLGVQMLSSLGLTSQLVRGEIFRLVQSASEPAVETESPITEETDPNAPDRELPSPPILGHDVKLNFADPTVRDGSFHSAQSVAFVMSFHSIRDLKPGVLFSGVLIGQTNRSFILENDRIAIQDGSVGRQIGAETWPVDERRFDKVITLPVTYGRKEYACPVRVEMTRHEEGSLTGSYWFCAYLSGRLPWGAGGRSFEIVNLDQQMEFRLVGDGTDKRDAVLGIDIDGDGTIDPSQTGGERLDLYAPFQIGSTTYQVTEVDPYLPRVVFHAVGPARTFATDPRAPESTDRDEPRQSQFIAELPNGVTVELLGACEHPSAGKQWWRPDGSPLKDAPYDRPGVWVTPGEPNRAPFELALRVRDLPENWEASVQSPGNSFSGAANPPYKAGKRLHDLRWLMIQVDPNQTTCTIRCDVVEPWQTIARTTPEIDVTQRPAEDGVTFSEIREAFGGGVSVTVAGPLGDRGDSFLYATRELKRIVAITKDGQIKESPFGGLLFHGEEPKRIGVTTKDGRLEDTLPAARPSDAGVRKATAYFFQLPLADIKEFQFQTRPLTWVEFKNVPLRPGRETDVQIAIGSAADNRQPVVLPDVDRNALMLDLATEQLVPLPHIESESRLLQAIEELGKGDVAYDGRALILLRNATSPQAEAGPTELVKAVKIGQRLPALVTVTTAEGRRYEIKILSADNQACELIYSPIPSDKGAGGGTSPHTPAKAAEPTVNALEDEIAGVVVDPLGHPIADAQVTVQKKALLLLPTQGRRGGRIQRPVIREPITHTDTQGRFRWTDLHPGVTDIVIAAKDHQSYTLRDISRGTTNLRVELRDPEPYALSGLVVDSAGDPVPGAEVFFTESPLSPRRDWAGTFRVTLTNGEGKFRYAEILQPITDGTQKRMLFVLKEDYGIWGKLLFSAGGEAFVRVTLRPQEEVSGLVVNEDNEPIPDAVVRMLTCQDSDEIHPWFFDDWMSFAPQTRTGPDGRFTLMGLPTDSTISLAVTDEGYASPEAQSRRAGTFPGYAVLRENGHAVSLASDIPITTPVTFTIQRAATLRGTVVYEDTSQPAADIRVAVQGQKSGAWSEDWTDAEGRFEITNVRPVPCNLMVILEDSDPEAAPDWTAKAVPLDDLRPGQIREDLQLTLTRGGTLQGQVVDAEGDPLKGIGIAFHSSARPRSSGAVQGVSSREDGTWAYRFPPGEVYAYISTARNDLLWHPPNRTVQLRAGQNISRVNFQKRPVLSQPSRTGTTEASVKKPAAAADKGAGGGALADTATDSTPEPTQAKSQNVVARLPNGVTVEFLAYSWLSPGGGLIWYDPEGQETAIPGVYEADVEGLGTVLAFRVEPAQASVYARLYRGPDSEEIKKTWQLPQSPIRLFALGQERRFATLRFLTSI